MQGSSSTRGHRAPRAVVLAVIAAVILAACGTHSDPSDKAAYVTAANRVCRDGNRVLKGYSTRIQAAQRSADPEAVFGRLAALTREAAGASQPYLDRLDALVAPAADRDALKGWIADQRRQQTLLAALGGAFGRRDETMISKLSQRIATLNTKSTAFAAKYGMEECAKDV